MLTHKLTPILQIQMVRQLLGAAGGTLVALTMYTGYNFAADAVRASLMTNDAPPEVSVETGTPTWTDEQRAENMHRVAEAARAAFERLEANEVH